LETKKLHPKLAGESGWSDWQSVAAYFSHSARGEKPYSAAEILSATIVNELLFGSKNTKPRTFTVAPFEMVTLSFN
jgi:hypothetical protein